ALLALLVLAAALPAEQKFDAPSGVTLLAQGGGRYLLLWDPIYRDDLQGYSVWLRKPGDKEFVRLSIPVKVGKEVKKEPMTSDSKIVLSMGRDRDDLEMTVVAEYEDGVSPKSRVARSALAMQQAAPPAPSAAAEGAAPVTGTAAAAASPTAAAGPYPTEADAAPAGLEHWSLPWNQRLERPLRPLLMPPGKLGTQLGVDFTYFRSIYSGNDRFGNLGLLGTGIDPNKEVYWQRIDVRTIFAVPLTLRWGLAPGLELWGQAAYHAEDYFLALYRIDGDDFSFIQLVHVNKDGSFTVLSNPTSTGIGDIPVGLRFQPVASQPLLLGLSASLPSGTSRFKSFLDWFSGRGSPAGTGEGILRLKADVDYGWKGLRDGLAFHGSYSPGGTEQYNEDNGSGGPPMHQVAVHGDAYELGGSWTWPWQVAGQSGSLALGLMGRSVQPDRWTTDGTDTGASLTPIERSQFAALTLLKFERDDQLEISLEAFQDLPGGLESSGKFSYSMETLGDQWSISGQLYY
ncbi:MAG TPA: hypothetical protein VNZ67_07525, partial [bacterium]|nr:hypothetical protein [bacterium]